MTLPARRLPSLFDKCLWTVLALLSVPLVAEANAGTPLMWAQMFHLVVGNLVIGLGEGFLISRVFHIPMKRATLVMICANYLSAWLGLVGLSQWTSATIGLNLANARCCLVVAFCIAYVFTLLVELPFIWWAFPKEKRSFKRAIKATFWANTVSYLLLGIWYSSLSTTSLVTGLGLLPLNQLNVPEGYAIYYIGEDAKTVLRADLSTGEIVAAAKLDPNVSTARLSDFSWWEQPIGIETREDGSVDLVQREASGSNVKTKVLIQRIENVGVSGEQERRTCVRCENESAFGTVEGDGWVYFAGFWALEGIKGRNEASGESFHYAFETPFFRWVVRNPTLLDDGYLVFNVSNKEDNEICILDPANKKIAVVARGSFPVVARGVSGVEQTDDTGH